MENFTCITKISQCDFNVISPYLTISQVLMVLNSYRLVGGNHNFDRLDLLQISITFAVFYWFYSAGLAPICCGRSNMPSISPLWKPNIGSSYHGAEHARKRHHRPHLSSPAARGGRCIASAADKGGKAAHDLGRGG